METQPDSTNTSTPQALPPALQFILGNKRNLCLAGCALMAIAVFFTFATISVPIFGTKSVSFIEGDGVIVLIAALAAGALIWFKKEMFSLIGTGIALITTLYDMANIGSVAEESEGLADASFGASPWLILIGVVLAAGPIIVDMLVAKGIIKTNK